MNPCTFIVFCISLCWAISVQADTGQNARTALVIGNSRYEPHIGPLRNTLNDAKSVAKTLRELGFAVIEKHNVTRDQLLKAVLDFRATLPQAEVGLFYFAGHGISVRGANYLIPLKSDYTPDQADDVTLRLLAETRLFNVEQVVADMSTAGAQCNLIILDACRTTAITNNNPTRDATQHSGLSEMNPPAGSLNGSYTEELLQNLSTPNLTIEQVFKRTRAGVLERSKGSQIPAEYSRLIGADIYLAGRSPSATSAPKMKSDSPQVPSQTQILNLAKAGMAEECADALLTVAEAQGPGDYAAEPLTLLLDQVKETLKDSQIPATKVETCASTCQHVLRALPICLPSNHEHFQQLQAKAHNRHGDALLLLDHVEEALTAYDTALALTPDDCYILYNRGRAFTKLGNMAEAKADFTAASDAKFNQPGARKLALEALAELP